MANNVVGLTLKIDAKQGAKSIDDLNKEMKETVEVTKSLRSQLKTLTTEMHGLEEGTEEFNKMAIAAGKLKDQISDTRSVINATAGSVGENLGTAFTKISGVGIHAFQGIAGMQAIFGDDAKELAKTMARLQGAMALSEAVKGLGALSDTFTEIKASIAAVSASYAKLAIVQKGQTLATEGGTTATKLLGGAMKALPIVAIIAGLTAIVAALYSYSKSSKEAEKEEKKRIETSKKAKEAADAQSKAIASESSEFVGLIYQLKSTNENSKERKKLMEDINKQYGTTLQNLSDETAFQEQLNVAVDEYINLQYVKFKLQKNQEYFQVQLAKQFKAEQEIAKLTKEAKGNYEAYGVTIGTASEKLDKYLSINSLAKAQFEEQKEIVREAEDALKKLGLSRDNLIGQEDKLTDGGKKYVEQTKKDVKETKVKEKAFMDASNAIEQMIKNMERLDAINEKIGEYESIKNLESALNSQLESIRISGQYATESIDMIIDSDHDRKEAQIKNDAEIAKEKTQSAIEIEAIDKEMNLALQKNDDDTAKERKETYATLEKAQEDYAQMVVESDNDVAENKAKNIEKNKEDIQSLITLYGNLGDIISSAFSGGDFEAINASFEALRTSLQEFIETDLTDFMVNWDEFTGPEKLKAIGDAAVAFTQITVDTIQSIFDAQYERDSEMRNQKYDADKNALETSLANRLITETEYNNKIRLLDQKKAQEELATKRKAFNQSKSLQIVNAVMQTANAVLSAFSSAAAIPIAGVALGPIMAGVAGALGAAQIAIISSQKFKAARGGVVPGVGSGSFDSVSATLAPGESVINANSTRMFPNLLSEINQVGGGISLAPKSLSSMGNMGGGNVYSANNHPQQIEAFVVETKRRKVSDRIDRMERSAEIGRD